MARDSLSEWLRILVSIWTRLSNNIKERRVQYFVRCHGPDVKSYVGLSSSWAEKSSLSTQTAISIAYNCSVLTVWDFFSCSVFWTMTSMKRIFSFSSFSSLSVLSFGQILACFVTPCTRTSHIVASRPKPLGVCETCVLSDAVRYRLQQWLSRRVPRSDRGCCFSRLSKYASRARRHVNLRSRMQCVYSEPLGWCKAWSSTLQGKSQLRIKPGLRDGL